MNMHISNLVSRVRALKQLLLQILKLGFEVPDLMTQAMSLLLKLRLCGGRGGRKTKLYRFRERGGGGRHRGREGKGGEREREREREIVLACGSTYIVHVHVLCIIDYMYM